MTLTVYSINEYLRYLFLFIHLLLKYFSTTLSPLLLHFVNSQRKEEKKCLGMPNINFPHIGCKHKHFLCLMLLIYVVIFTHGNIVHILHPSTVCSAVLALPLWGRGPRKKKLSWRVIFKEILSLPNTTDPLECECRHPLILAPSSKKIRVLCC